MRLPAWQAMLLKASSEIFSPQRTGISEEAFLFDELLNRKRNIKPYITQ